MTLISTRVNLCASENPLKLNHAQRTPALFGQIVQTGPNVLYQSNNNKSIIYIRIVLSNKVIKWHKILTYVLKSESKLMNFAGKAQNSFITKERVSSTKVGKDTLLISLLGLEKMMRETKYYI